MKAALAVVLVVAIVVVLFYVARSKAETLPTGTLDAGGERTGTPGSSPEPAGTLAAAPPMREVTFVLERTAEEKWRAAVMLSAQAYARAARAWYDRRVGGLSGASSPTPRVVREVENAGKLARAAEAIAAAAPMESRAQLMFRIGFASKPDAAYPGSVTRAWDALVAAVRAPIDFQPTLPVVPTATGIVPLGDLQV